MKGYKDKIIEKALDTNFSGVVSIFQDNNEILNQAFGYKDSVNKILNKKNTKFGIASGTKFFTALGIGKLIDENIISLKTKLKDIDRDFCTFVNEDVTIHNLLTHTSGIFDYYDEEIDTDPDNFFVDIPWNLLETPSDYLPLFFNQKQKFKPGERFSYSNGGFVFLGILIEKLSGSTFRDYIHKNVLLPAKMGNSGFYAFNELPPNTAYGYKKNRKTTNIYNLPIRGGGDGGMYTNTFDLCSFWEQLFSYKIISKELSEIFLKTQWEFNSEKGYGCGINKTLDNSMYYIIGGDAGVGFDSRYLPREKICLTIISNVTDGEEELRDIILSVLEIIKKSV